jgi:hypothetical protein
MFLTSCPAHKKGSTFTSRRWDSFAVMHNHQMINQSNSHQLDAWRRFGLILKYINVRYRRRILRILQKRISKSHRWYGAQEVWALIFTREAVTLNSVTPVIIIRSHVWPSPMVFTRNILLASYSKCGNTFLTSPEKQKMRFPKTSDIVEAAVIELGRGLNSTVSRVKIARWTSELLVHRTGGLANSGFHLSSLG